MGSRIRGEVVEITILIWLYVNATGWCLKFKDELFMFARASAFDRALQVATKINAIAIRNYLFDIQ